ncbi:MAG: hypothetical protein O3C45_00300 [Bacteroidetes bacterium]|nr:hypothetical protein [Bacteroidota bacterium]
MRLLHPLLLALFLLGCGPRSALDFQAGDLSVSVGQDGSVASMQIGGTEVLAPGVAAPLLSLRVDSTFFAPEHAAWDADTEVLTLSYAEGRTAQITVSSRETHARLEVTALSDTAIVDLVLWGPYPTTMDEVIGETVGVVQEGKHALGLQALNIRTLGGYPWNENDAMPQIDIFESGDFTDLSEEGKRHVLYRVEAAKPDSFGSTLQAYTRNRNRTRSIPNMGYPVYQAPAFQDGGMVGSAIALFGSDRDKALETLGAIELAEGLPHPILDGVWAKQAPRAAQAYVIMPFSEETVDEALDIVERAGMEILYHPDPFSSWGHFTLREDDFPNGVDGLKRLSERAAERGMRLGGHTLSNFIQPQDAFVSPVPDERLAVVGSAPLTEGFGPNTASITVASDEPFRAGQKSTLKTVRIGDELIQYTGVSPEAPWQLTGLTRGAFGTRAAAHEAGSPVSLLADHGYRVFLTNPELTIEMAQKMAAVYAGGGLKHVSFDGLEGNRSTGMGNYGEILFAQSFWDALPEADREDWIVTASRTSHWFWHLYTRMNWGEPWYAGFRESQTEYRMKNQAYFRRNFMPAMLGWFSLRPETSVEDIEWMLARSAAYDAGYALSTSMEALQENGRTGEILTLLNRWERARLGGFFSPSQKAAMEDVSGEFHLDEPAQDSFLLTPVATHRLTYVQRERQPGEPAEETHAMENAFAAQSLFFTVRAAEGALESLFLGVEGAASGVTVSLEEGQILAYRGGASATVYSPSWQVVRQVRVNPDDFRVPEGAWTLMVKAPAENTGASGLIELRLSGPAESLMR